MNAQLIAVQLEIDANVLASPEAYRAHLEDVVACAVEEAVSEARSEGETRADGAHRLVVLPELAGHLALLALAPPGAHRAKSLGAALAAAAARRPLEVLRGVATTRVLHPRHAVLAALAPDGERFWRAVFGPLARRHRAYVVAGSYLRLSSVGDLLNASLVFSPDGKCLATTDKVNLVPGIEDGAPKALGLARGDAERLPIVETPFGPLATLICYDGFHVPHTTSERFTSLPRRLASTTPKLAIVANPSANIWSWHGAWPPPGSGAASRADSRAEQWRRDGLPGSLASFSFARFGVTAHLVGAILDLRFEGVSEILERDADGVRVLARTEACDRGGHVVATVTC